MPSTLSLAVVGAAHPNERGPTRRFELALCAPGEPVELRPEPKNKADPHAVAVYSCRDVQLGYLTAERAPWIGGMIRAGREIAAAFQASTKFGGWIRVAFDGADPVLPVASAAPEHDPDSQDGVDPDWGWPE